MISIFNTMSMSKESFEPFQSPSVGIFICGPTVYDYSHVGHARLFIVYDVIARYLRARRYAPFMLVNLTDIDPKVLERAKREEVDYKTLTSKYTRELQKDLAMLDVQSISSFAVGSDYVEQVKENIKAMLREGFAYTANGNVYFDTGKVREYGKLSRQSVDDMLMRPIDLGPNKVAKHDFLVWDGRHHLGVSWESDFGHGIPWWHIQDSSVAIANLHSRYDIHGGAKELLYPHHEAHLAQMKVLTKEDKPVKYWTHTGMVRVDGQKMSKSLGNIVGIREVVRKYGSESLRLYLLSKHYREDIVFNEDSLAGYSESVRLLRSALEEIKDSGGGALGNEARRLVDDFYGSMDDDFDTSRAIDALLSLSRGIAEGRIKPSSALKESMDGMVEILGLRLA